MNDKSPSKTRGTLEISLNKFGLQVHIDALSQIVAVGKMFPENEKTKRSIFHFVQRYSADVPETE